MKARYKTFSVTQIDKEIKRASLEELRRFKDEVYQAATWDIFQQALAVCFTALELMGWRKKRLTEFKNRCDDVCHMMYHGVMGKEFTTRQAIEHLREEYGIDFTQSQYDDYGDGGTENG